MNSTPYLSGDWDGDHVILSLDGLEVGVYFFTVRVNDTSGNIAEDTVLVTVVPASGLDITTILIIAGAALVVIIIIAVVVKKRKK
jgi:subtilase family serine protease